MKKRDIILDFTPLLDVTLIIIFFFVIFSNLDSQANKARTDAKEKELAEAVQQAESREASAKELEEQLQREIDSLKESDSRRGSNASEILYFKRSDNIKIILDIEDDSWNARVVGKNEIMATITEKDSIGEKLLQVLNDAGYSNDDTVFCDFVFDGSKPGSFSAYRRLKDELSAIQKNYKYLYISETDLSIGEP